MSTNGGGGRKKKKERPIRTTIAPWNGSDPKSGGIDRQREEEISRSIAQARLRAK